jgi:amino acid adenylation domain-containing protein
LARPEVMSKIPTKLSDLSPEQRDLVLRRLAKAKPNEASANAIPRRPPGEAPPLSYAQERAWFLDCLAPGDPAHNITGGLRLQGELSFDALSFAFNEIIRRHEPLRSNFQASDTGPLQIIHAPFPLPIERIDLTNLDAPEKAAEQRKLYLRESYRRFNLADDQLLKVTLVRLGQQEHLLLLAMHHIVSDGWSIGVLMDDLSRLYTAFAESRKPDLAELPVQYADFAAWQRKRVESGALDAGLSYWKEQLREPPPILEMPTDRPIHVGQHRDLAGATCSVRVDRDLKRALEDLSRREGTTLFVTMLAAFLTLMMRCTCIEDLLVGCPVSGRVRVETEGLIGLFLNTIALRVKLTPGLTFREAVGRVRQTVLDGLANHEVPIEQVVQNLGPAHRSTNHPLFETIFNFTPTPPRRLEIPGLRTRFEDPPTMGAKFALELYLTEWDGTLELKLLYPEERYSEARMTILLDQLKGILEQIAGDPDQTLARISLVAPGSQALLPDPTAALDAPLQTPVASSILDWADRAPKQPAVCQGDFTLTYGQFASRMRGIAEALCAKGATPGDVVAVTGPRSPGVIVAMAGVLLSRGVLLTLSPDLPEHRHRLMLQEAGARFLVYVGETRAADRWLSEVDGLTLLHIPLDGAVESSGSTVPISVPEQRDPAYIFFTSGSTGKPKGVLGAHAGLAHFLSWQRQEFGIGPGDRCGQLTGLSFDVVLRAVFLPLTSGAALVLPPEGQELSGRGILHWLESERITLLHSVPAIAETWIAGATKDVSLRQLKRIFFAGEPLTSALIAQWRAAFSATGPSTGEIVNLYGPTETTLAKCFYRVPDEPVAGVQPVGQTLPQTQTLVLSPERRLCGVGEPGEIAIRTPFRTLGYINAAEENQARFIVNPFTNDPEDLLYLTGDRGVRGASGLLEFLGRLDNQVKIRGVRIEPMEVASVLKTSPDVAACAVIVRQDGNDGPALVAYVVSAKGSAENPARLQEFLSQRLMPAMLPSAFVFLEQLPLTSNQKVDREKLPPPSAIRPSLETSYVAPRDATELRLVQIWEDLLGVRPIGVKDNFFMLGGHSLKALRLMVEMERGLGTRVPLGALFECPTVEHLAAVSRRQESDSPLLVNLWSANHRVKLFLVHPGGGMLLNYAHLVRLLAAPVPIYGIQAQGLDGKQEPHRDIEQMAAAYLDQVLQTQPEGPYLLAGHSLGGVVAFEMSRQLLERGHRVAYLALLDSALTRADRGQASTASAEDERLLDARHLADMVAVVERFVGRDLGVVYEQLSLLETDQQIEHVVAALQQSDFPLLSGGVDLVRQMLRVGKAHVHAGRNYHAQPCAATITLVRAQDAGTPSGADETLGWSAVARDVRVVWTPGDHVTMLAEPNVATLADVLRNSLNEVLPTLQV